MSTETYFQRLHRLTENRFWVNNPTPDQAERAVAAGAIACTTNPTYGWKQLNHPETADGVRSLFNQLPEDPPDAADAIQIECVKRILPVFDRIRESSSGTGFVSIQGNPFRDDDPDWIEREARNYLAIAPNVIAKIPVTSAGLVAIEHLLADGKPVIATEVMSVSQAVSACRAYERATSNSGKTPPYFVTHITGIFDEFLHAEAQVSESGIEPDILWQAGILLARHQYEVMREMGFGEIPILGGGARSTHHFTELVGSNAHITINWEPTAVDLMATDPHIQFRMSEPVPPFMIDMLCRKSPTFLAAYQTEGLSVDEFEDFGPVQLFRSMFCEGWQNLEHSINRSRST